MLKQRKVLKQYLEKELTSSSPEKLILKLYDGAIGFAKAALFSLEKNDSVNKAKFLNKAVNIVDYLRSCLDFEKGEEVSENLDRIYEYTLLQLTDGNLKNDVDKIKEAIDLLHTIKDGWAGLCEGGKDAFVGGVDSKAQVVDVGRCEGFTAVA